MSYQDAIDLSRFWLGCPSKPGGQIPGEHYIVAAIDQDDFALWCFNHGAVALLHIDEVELQHAIVRGFYGDGFRLYPGRRDDEARRWDRLESFVGGFKLHGTDLNMVFSCFENLDSITPCKRSEKLAFCRRVEYIGKINVDDFPG